ncbi:MAG: DUF2309 domain-containing protein [Planctomycetes bacterium]|nr:DUF2309 domain-containing protein [Planctomycetota bacterium]
MTSASTVESWLAYCRPLLPLQNPLWAFIHNNILLQLEDRPFLDAVRRAAGLYRARPYESEEFFRRELARGRIDASALEQVLAERLPELPQPRSQWFLANPTVGETLPAIQSLRLCPRLEELGPLRTDRALKDLLVPMVAAWLDQGQAAWTSPLRSESLWSVFCATVDSAPHWGFGWASALKARMASHARRDVLAVIEHEVRECAGAGSEAEYCLETLFTLKGWSGMIHRLESEPALAPLEAPPRIALADWLAVLLVAQHALEEWLLARYGASRAALREVPCPVAQTRGLARAHLWQEAYERSFGAVFLERVERGIAARAPAARPERRAQALVCMDDREESFRRALEHAHCDIETFGAVGFFGIDMRFEALGRSQATRQCPPVIEPSRTLREHALDGEGAALERMRRTTSTASAASLATYYSSRTLVRGVAVSLALGMLGFLPLVLKTAQPARLSRWRRWVTKRAFPRPRTRIELQRDGGYSLDEQARIVHGVLTTCGLLRDFAPLVAVIAHGSTSSNNPFRHAYGCGACSGNNGAPNARAFAAMANAPEVRLRVAALGLDLPATTLFVPCLHDTALDSVDLLDRETLPAVRREELAQLEQRLLLAGRRNAAERCRRFELAPAPGVHGKLEALLQHVEDRGHDLAQPRPEYGHNRVAACIVGRRELTKGVSLDRRSFLVSYDPATDPDGSVLSAAVLGSVPVAVNIAMDYYFSRVDPEGFGAGSKLPLNIVSLLGVITGSKSDLRIGLSRQMVELHEPMRVLVLLEAATPHVLALLAGHARLARLVQNGWMQLGRIDPVEGRVELLRDGCFLPWREAWPEAREARPSRVDMLAPSGDALIGGRA